MAIESDSRERMRVLLEKVDEEKRVAENRINGRFASLGFAEGQAQKWLSKVLPKAAVGTLLAGVIFAAVVTGSGLTRAAESRQITYSVIETQSDLAIEDVPASKLVIPTKTPEAKKAKEMGSAIELIAKRTIEQFNYKDFFYPVSSQEALPDSYPEKQAELGLEEMGGIKVAKIALPDLKKLLSDAQKTGFRPQLVSGFRSIDYQKQVFERNVQKEMSEDFSRRDATNRAKEYSAEPGYSEHHLGLAVDVLDGKNSDWDFARANYDRGFYGWLRQHAHEYGFVLSYPTSADNIQKSKPGSGYGSAEPWHMRFVGKEAARYLYQKDYLNSNNPITVDSFLQQVHQSIKGEKR